MPDTIDSQALRAVACHWLRHISNTDAPMWPDNIGQAAESCFPGSIELAKDAAVGADEAFDLGMEFGLDVARIVMQNPLGNPLPEIEALIENMKRELGDSRANALRDRAIEERNKQLVPA